MKIFIILAVIIGVAALVGHLALAHGFAARVASLRRTLLDAQVLALPDQTLIPQLVRDFALRNGGSVGGPSALVMVQGAEMRLQPSQPFFHLDATQLTGTRTPGFVWHAAGTMSGFIPLQIVDSYVAGAGLLEVRIAGSIPVASGHGADIDKGEAMRFLAELAWNPDALLNTSLLWRQIDGRTIEVALQTNGGAARVTLSFDAAGDIVAIEASDRPRAVGNASLPTRWIGRFSDYVQAAQYRWPRHGEISWVLPEGEFTYWRGNIASLTAAP